MRVTMLLLTLLCGLFVNTRMTLALQAGRRTMTSARVASRGLAHFVSGQNFLDVEVECTSEGGDWRVQVGEALPPSQAARSPERLREYADNKAQNFRDDEVDCMSESGKWTVAVNTVDSRSRLVSSDRRDFAGLESWGSTLALVAELSVLAPTSLNIVALCDRIDASAPRARSAKVLRFFRSRLLVVMLRCSRQEYIATANFLQARIPRSELPNLQQLEALPAPAGGPGDAQVADCALPPLRFAESPLDRLLLRVFRGIVQRETGYASPQLGIQGLLDEGKTYMLSPAGTPENQHAFVRRTLATLMTPVLPPFYRLFMAGMVPSRQRGDPQWLEDAVQRVAELLPEGRFRERLQQPGTQLGPWFYAPALTSVVTPPLLNFLVGPSRTNYRSDGQPGGLVVERCKFLQESACKGLCLHQCKLPAQQFFADTLGVPLTVEPNFSTQECQWSWGQVPLPHDEDPAYPQGCLVGCPTRQGSATERLSPC